MIIKEVSIEQTVGGPLCQPEPAIARVVFQHLDSNSAGRLEESYRNSLDVDICLKDIKDNKYLNLGILPSIKRVIFNCPATIVLWNDNTKTVVKAQDGEKFDKEKGLALCFMKKATGNQGNYYNKIKKWLYEDEKANK